MYSLIDPYIINVLSKYTHPGIDLSNFTEINTIRHNMTIVMLIDGLRRHVAVPFPCARNIFSDVRLNYPDFYKSGEYGECDTVAARNNIRANIILLLKHPEMDFTIQQNLEVLREVIKRTGIAYWEIGNDDIIEILTLHNLNPDVIMGESSIGILLIHQSRLYFDENETCIISAFIERGANVELELDPTNLQNQPYFRTAHLCTRIRDVVISRTTNFYKLGEMIKSQDLSERGLRVIDGIAKHGKMPSLKYLSAEDYEKIQAFEGWIRNIRKLNLTIQEMREHFSVPIQNFQILNFCPIIDQKVRNMCLFRQNLECLTQSTVATPAYKYYHVAIIILFLIHNRHLTVLTCDVLRHIATLVFS